MAQVISGTSKSIKSWLSQLAGDAARLPLLVMIALLVAPFLLTKSSARQVQQHTFPVLTPTFLVDATVALPTALNTQLNAGGTTTLAYRLVLNHGTFAIATHTLRRYIESLPAELQGNIETRFRNLSITGEIKQQSAQQRYFSGNIKFTGLQIHLLDNAPLTFSLNDMDGVAKVDTPLPLGRETTLNIERLKIGNAKATMAAGVLDQYVSQLPMALRGPIDSSFAALNVAGRIAAEGEGPLHFRGNIRLQDLNVHTPASDTAAFALEQLTVAAQVVSPLDRWAPESLTVRDGKLQWSTLTYGTNTVNTFDASWRIDSHNLIVERCTAQIFDGHISGALSWDLATQVLSNSDFHIQNLDTHKALANLSPEHIDAEGKASGNLRLAQSPENELSGSVQLTFDEPGVLKIGDIEEVKQMLVGNFGLALANLAMHDLQQYPFQKGWLSLESMGTNSELKIKFVRQQRTEGNKTPPHKEIINGQEVWVGSLVVPTIDMTIPITGKSLAEILSLASGIQPTSADASESSEK